MARDSRASGFSLKDQLFNRERVEYLGRLLGDTDADFDVNAFVNQVMDRLTKLELKERIVHIAETLESHLSSDFRVASRQIVNALPPPLDSGRTDDDFGDFIFAPLGEFVVRNGLAKQHLHRSLKTLKALTQRFSMEDAIRYFIDTYPNTTFKTLEEWSTDEHYHVRRLVSEGTRARLPWSKRLSIDITRPLPLLDRLHADPTRYVTRSVANHLNDLAKTHPELVIETLARWKKLGVQDTEELHWISRHALRTLVKQGHPKALRFLGFRPNPKIQVDRFGLKRTQLHPGDAIELSVRLTAHREESLMVDYVIDFVKANGKWSPKVHKLKQLQLGKGEQRTLSQRHVLRANATTYTLYPGTHRVTLQINGKPYGTQTFELAM